MAICMLEDWLLQQMASVPDHKGLSPAALPFRSMVLQRRNMHMAMKFASRLITVSGAALGAYVFFVRPRQRRWGAIDEEVERTLPGDELIARPDVKFTRAVTIR